MDSTHTRRSAGLLKVAVPALVLIGALVVLINVLASSGGSGVAPVPAAFAQRSTLDDALTRAASNGRLVFGVATADWCPPCQTYKRGALADERVAEWLGANAEAVLIDVTGGATPTTERLAISAIPASFVLDAEGNVVTKWTGDLPPDELLARLEAARAQR
jgi:thiol:disulfide interchange protein